jgi:hypothetical protein
MQKKNVSHQTVKKARLSPEQRARRNQQIFVVALAVIVIISMLLSLVKIY